MIRDITLTDHGYLRLGVCVAEEENKGLASLESEFAQVSGEFKEFNSKMRDPLVVASMLTKLTEERQSTNLLLREINAKLDRIASLEARVNQLENSRVEITTATSAPFVQKRVLLPEIDMEIIAFMKKGAVCAEEIQEQFKYKGKNAASARLNKLCALGMARKTQVGKKVYFELIEKN